MNCRSVTDPSRCTKKETSASRGVLCGDRCQRRRICETMFCRYSGKGNSIPSVLTVATSLPVDGFSPGKGCALGVVRGAAPGVRHARRRLARRRRRRLLLRLALDRLGRLALLLTCLRGRDEPDPVRGRRKAPEAVQREAE